MNAVRLLRISCLSVLLSLGAVGCGGASEVAEQPATQAPAAAPPDEQAEAVEEPAPSPVVGGPGTYEFEYLGTTATLEVPTATSDARLADVEAYRQEAGAAEVSYVVADVDNTNGTENINMYQIVVVTEDGQQVEFGSLDPIISEWRDLISPNGEDIDASNRGSDLINEHQVYLLPGAKESAILAAKEQIQSVARVYVYPAGGFDMIEATKAL